MREDDRPSILLVEDSDEVRDGMSELLQQEGFRVIPARSGREALDRLLEHPKVAVIVLDALMPEMDGYDFRVAQLTIDSLAHIGVILLSGDGELPAKAKQLGVEHWLQKPVDPEELLALIRQHAAEAA